MTYYLSQGKSMCGKRQAVIVSEEKGLEHRAINLNSCLVRQYRIDGDIISGNQNIKCDYLVLNDDKKTAYYIELKRNGRISEAIQQIEETVKVLKSDLIGNYTNYYRIIYNRSNTHGVYASAQTEWKRKNNGRAVVKQGKYEDEI